MGGLKKDMWVDLTLTDMSPESLASVPDPSIVFLILLGGIVHSASHETV